MDHTAAMLIRRERPVDTDAIDAIHRAAFASVTPDATEPAEVGLVHALRASEAWLPALTLVAEEPTGTLTGHVCLTRGDVAGRPALALGPIGVLPDRQRTGVGGALMHAALGAADALDEQLVVLLGHTGYYPRFGFVPTADLGVEPDVAEWAGPHFQARALDAHDPSLRGVFRYPAPFYAL